MGLKRHLVHFMTQNSLEVADLEVCDEFLGYWKDSVILTV